METVESRNKVHLSDAQKVSTTNNLQTSYSVRRIADFCNLLLRLKALLKFIPAKKCLFRDRTSASRGKPFFLAGLEMAMFPFYLLHDGETQRGYS